MLAIDCGNTNLKWAIFSEPTAGGALLPPLQSGSFAIAQISEHLPLLAANFIQVVTDLQSAPKHKVMIANVAGNVVADAIKNALSHTNVNLNFIASQVQACGVRNGYQQPHTLGVDRFAALVAAQQQAQNQLVVMVGTALTIDALNDAGEFLGGLIVPGLLTMQQSLRQRTAQLPQVGIDSALICAFPTSTQAAIASGAMAACVGAVSMQAHTFAQTLRAKNKNLTRIVIAGGGAADMLSQLIIAIAAIFTNTEAVTLPSIVLRPNLVLEGLHCLAQETAGANASSGEFTPSV